MNIHAQVEQQYRLKKTSVLLSVSLVTLHRWIASGKIKSTLLGPKIRVIPESEIRRLLAGTSTDDPATPSATPGVTVHRIAK